MTKREELLAKIEKAKTNKVLTEPQRKAILANYEKQLADLPAVSTGNKAEKKAAPKKAASKKEPSDKEVLDYLKKEYPRYTNKLLVEDNGGEELSDDEYNDKFFEMVDDLREKFYFKDEQTANYFAEKHMDYSEPKKAEPKAKKSSSTGGKSDKDEEYDCDEIIKDLKEKRAKAKARAKVESHKSEGKKGKEKIERVHDSIEKKIEKKAYTKPQLESIIKETETLLKALKAALKSL